ncbi:uncharacterized protein [Venturia canescens]|uniref:uncharacterized protein isoform X2 n=1 Tax=Venturia canescens TaxID=32260 RepID=UPI001C9C4E94|nr:uncharacterized protein LOC122412454 isoform X2 [Venturia canescens]
MALLLNKIMDYFQFKLLILSIILCQVSGERSWGSDRARYDGYDLQKGPVFYEAYYADENQAKTTEPQQFRGNIKPEEQNFNGGMMIEKMYQTAGKSSVNRANWSPDEPRSQGTVDRFYTQQNQAPISNFDSNGDNRRQMRGQGNVHFIENRRFDEEYIKPILSAIENSAREILIKEFEKVREMQDTIENVKTSRSPRVVDLENRVSDGRRIPVGNPEPPSRSNQPNSFDQSLDTGSWKNWRANDYFTDHNRLEDSEFPNSVPRKPFAPEINNFQPESSNYVKSATTAPAREQHFAPGIESPVKLPKPQSLTSNYWPTKDFDYRNTETHENTRNTRKSNEIVPGVASIEISEMPRHKTRHHHGEKPRISKQHRRQTPVN